jgi:hypothetical protein
LFSPQSKSVDTSSKLADVARVFKYFTMFDGAVEELHDVVTSLKGVYSSDDATMATDTAL